MAEVERVVPYVDIPLQHADTDVLRRMRRGGSAASFVELLTRFRRAMPGVPLRTTFIVGFPGETEAEFENLLAFVREVGFDHVGAFPYSHEEGTRAFAAQDDVPPKLKQERFDRLMETQREIVLKHNGDRIGETVEVLVGRRASGDRAPARRSDANPGTGRRRQRVDPRGQRGAGDLRPGRAA